MAWAISTATPPSFPLSSPKLFSSISSTQISPSFNSKAKTPLLHAHFPLVSRKRNSTAIFYRRPLKEYKFPDPIPEFADSETEKFKAHLVEKLSKKDTFGDSLDEVVEICTEIFNKFLHTEYGGPGTLMVVPFIDMADTLNEKGLPGGPQAARVAVKWAQAHVDNDWKEWNSS